MQPKVVTLLFVSVLMGVLLAPGLVLAAGYANSDLLIETAQLEKMLNDPGVRVVDARPNGEYKKGHIPGAVNLSYQEIDDPKGQVENELLPTETLATMLGDRGIEDYIRSNVSERVRDFNFLEAAILIGHVDGIASLAGKLTATVSGRFLKNPENIGTAAGRLFSAAAASQGKPEEALDYCRQAIAACEKARFRPELALCRLQLAELLFDHFPEEREEAQRQLDSAIAEFRVMKMQPSLERALSRKQVLEA